MNIRNARVWLIVASLGITSAAFGFFLLAPAIGFPLAFEQAIRLLEIVTPVFFSYLGSATYFIFHKSESEAQVKVTGSPELLALVLKGPIYVFGVAMLAAIVGFGYSNRAAAPAGAGMSVDLLAASISAALGLLAVTTNVIVSYIFSSGEQNAGKIP
jgi:hypothetical protein